MIDQLLEITTTPMKYELQVSGGRLEAQTAAETNATRTTHTGHVHANRRVDPTAASDTYQGSRSTGDGYGGTEIQNAGTASDSSLQTYVTMGQQASADSKVAIPDSVRQKIFSTDTGSALYTAFLPQGGGGISWQPSGVGVSPYTGDQAGSVQDSEQLLSDEQRGEAPFGELQTVPQPQYQYIPGEVHMKILEYARVEVKYLGGPIYFPASSDPNYDKDKIAG